MKKKKIVYLNLKNLHNWIYLNNLSPVNLQVYILKKMKLRFETVYKYIKIQICLR